MKINSKAHWEKRYRDGGDSGYGSYGEQANLKIKLIKENVSDIKSIIDFGCGDFSFGKRVIELFPKASYVGIDQSSYKINELSAKYPEYKFINDFNLKSDAGLLLCIDVLFHVLDDEDCKKIIDDLKKHWTKYLVLSAFDRDGEPEPNGQAVMRRFPEEEFGKPLVKELLEPNGAYLYIWKK